jgi:pantoate--beta-alanine ligase
MPPTSLKFGTPMAQGLRVVRELDELRAGLDQFRAQNPIAAKGKSGRVVLVPTMGNLHAGHMALVRRAREIGDLVIATIFVNRFQFSPSEDFDTYPRTFDDDLQLLADNGCDLVFAPDSETVYPRGPDEITRVTIPALGEILCGASRPEFFRGVSTVVSVLLNMVQPDVAMFGEKDYQQLLIIRRMVGDLRMRVQIESVAIVRESDGLAMSSRNGYLSDEERACAPVLYQTLQQAREELINGETDFAAVQARATTRLIEAGFKPDYFEICRQSDLAPAMPGERSAIVLAAAYLGAARLIDNIRI